MKTRIHNLAAGTAALAGLLLAALSMAAPCSAQEDSHHAAPDAADRGDVHSRGWARVEELKGDPLPPKFPELGEDVHRTVLDNGLVIYLREDRTLPLVSAQLVVKTGSLYESDTDHGLASMTAGQMSEGGAGKLGPQELADRLAFLAVSIGAFAGDDTARVTLNTLTEHTDEAFGLFADVVLRPRFDEERIELSKRNQLFRLRFRNDSPRTITQRELNTLLYGDHPRGRDTRPEHVMSLDRDRIVAHHRQTYRPDRAYLAVTGDFDTESMLARLELLFGSSWERSEEALPPRPEVKAVPKPGIYVVDKDLEQSNIVLAHWGVDRTHPDRFAIDLMNDILGGGSFSSRVTERVRSDEGLAYSAGTSYGTNDRDVGLFRASVQTKTGTTVKAVRLLLDEIEKMKEGAVSDNEFNTVREAVLYSYVFRFDDPEQNVGRLMGLEIEGLPADNFQKEFAGYRAVTKADVEKAAKKHLHPDRLTIFIVGKLDDFRSELAELGTIHEIELEEFEMPRGAFGPGRREGGGPPGRGGRRGEGD